MPLVSKVQDDKLVYVKGSTFNWLVDTVRRLEKDARRNSMDRKRPTRDNDLLPAVAFTFNVDFPWYGVGTLQSPLVDANQQLLDWKNTRIWNVAVPGDDDRPVIWQTATKSGEQGFVCVDGITHARVYMNNADDKYATTINNNVTYLDSTTTPTTARILYTQTGGVGEQWAMIHLGHEAPGGETQPVGDTDTRLVWVKANGGAVTNAVGHSQPPDTGCIWPGATIRQKLLSDPEGCASPTTNFEEIEDVWIMQNSFWQNGIVRRFDSIPLWMPLMAHKVNSAFDHEGDTRELWMVSPYKHEVDVIEIGANGGSGGGANAASYIYPDADDHYDGQVKTQGFSRIIADKTNATLPSVGTGSKIYAMDLKGRKPVRPGFYLGYMAYINAGAQARPLYYFDSGDMNQAASWRLGSGSGIVLGAGTSTIAFQGNYHEGVLPGVAFDTQHNRFTFEEYGNYKFHVNCNASASASACKVSFFLERSIDSGVTWFPGEALGELVSGTLTNGAGHITELFEIDPGNFVRLRMTNITASREVVVSKISCVIERCYERSFGG